MQSRKKNANPDCWHGLYGAIPPAPYQPTGLGRRSAANSSWSPSAGACSPRRPEVGDEDALGVEAHAGGFAVVGVVVARELEVAPEDIDADAEMEPGFAVVGVPRTNPVDIARMHRVGGSTFALTTCYVAAERVPSTDPPAPSLQTSIRRAVSAFLVKSSWFRFRIHMAATQVGPRPFDSGSSRMPAVNLIFLSLDRPNPTSLFKVKAEVEGSVARGGHLHSIHCPSRP
ncbi:hypothetical protein B0H14DRAFT_2599573 [Mycena olivaceomarginata]|nr:hypothetical protein B0H14DRAFT_2599573 [Mycena olivaceomarginata]